MKAIPVVKAPAAKVPALKGKDAVKPKAVKSPKTHVMPTAKEKQGVHIIGGGSVTLSMHDLRTVMNEVVKSQVTQARPQMDADTQATGEPQPLGFVMKASNQKSADSIKAQSALEAAQYEVSNELEAQRNVIMALESRLDPIMYGQSPEPDKTAESAGESSSSIIANLEYTAARIRHNNEVIMSLINRLPT